ncbi:MAG TPA: TonB-dependent receptor [Chitinophagaceae bacterium]|nr:TonB-dependent receptor [Chitinophagaceae bacterium]
MRFYFSFFIFLFYFINSTISIAQSSKITLSGYIRDQYSGENLPSATVGIIELKRGGNSNNYGFYSISIPKGTYTIKISYIGYETQLITIDAKEDKTLNFDLVPKNILKNEVVIKDKRKDENVKSTEMGLHKLSMESVKKLPVIMGEVDVLKSLQLLPGVSSAGEGQSGFYVRGGGPDQNLILLDDAVVYNTGHLFGFFSVFNGDAIKNVTLIKGAAPANYGGRLSSVVDITMKEGNNKMYQAEGGIGLIASRFSIQGPILKNKASFMVSARRTYIDAIVKPFVKSTSTLAGSGYYFYDLNAKMNYIISKRDRLYLSGYFGKDVFTFKNSERTFNVNVPWGNSTATLRWNHQFSNKIFMNTTLMYNDYNFAFQGEQQNFNVKLFSGIRDWSGKFDIDYYSKFNHNFKFGGVYTYHTFTPSSVSGKVDSIELKPNQSFKKYAHEFGLYALDEFDLGNRVKINIGIRYSQFLQVGPYTRYRFDDNEKKVDSVTYRSGDLAKSYGGFEPRFNARFTIDETSSIKASIAKTYQYLHLVTNNGSTLPTDIWTPSSYLVKPQKAWQYSLGYFKNFFNNKLETSVEVYYKDLQNLLEYREGYTPSSLRDIDYDFVFGRGYAYGAEFFVNKTKGKWSGWISYTLAWTYRDFKDLNLGERYLAKYDQRHNLSITNTYEINKKWTASMVFVFGSGNRISLPTELYTIDNTLLQNYDKLNNYSLPPYHRLDLAAIYTPHPNSKKRMKGSWTFSIYNVYSRQNPYLVYLDVKGNIGTGVELKVKQVSIFPILPSITYNFKINKRNFETISF